MDPLMPPPPGQVTNFVNPPSMSWAGRVTVYTTLPLMILALVVRMYVRVQKKQFAIDDYLILFAAACAATTNGVQLPIFLNDVYGRHSWDIPRASIGPDFLLNSLVANCLYAASAMFAKISLLVFFRRIFYPSRVANIFIWIGVSFIAVYYTASIIVAVVLIYPRRGEGGWSSPRVEEGRGNMLPGALLAQGIINAATDFYVLAIPLSMVSQLQLPPLKKLGVSCIFLTGLLSCGCSIAGAVLRAPFLEEVTKDSRWVGVKYQALGIAEINVGIICGCMPMALYFCQRVKQKLGPGISSIIRLLTISSTRRRVTPRADLLDSDQYPLQQLPTISKGGLTGLRSFIRGNPRTEKDTTLKSEVSTMGAYVET